MFDFAHPYLLFLLGALLLFGALYVWSRHSRKRKLRRFGKLHIIAPLMPMASKYMPNVKFAFQMLALASLVIILARPRAGEKDAEEKADGIEVMIAFDVSNSMLASSTDDKNGVSRLDRAKLTMEKLVDGLDNDRVGLVVFAGEPKMQLPLTTDFSSAKMYLNDLTPEMIAAQGTSLAEALVMATKGFTKLDDKDKAVGRAIILLTDAEDHEGQAVEAAKAAADQGIQVNVIGLGTAKGAPIPLRGKNGDYMRDNTGNVVITKLNEQIGQDVAKAGGGIYVNGASAKALPQLIESLDNTLAKTEMKSVKYKASAEQFPTFAWLALIFMVIDLILPNRKIGWLTKYNFFSK